MKRTLSILFCFLTLSVSAQKQIKAEEAKNHVGDTVKVMGQVYGGKYLSYSKDSLTFLNIGADYPNAPLTVVIRKNVRSQFKEAPEVLWNKQWIYITGRIELYKDKPQIVLSSAGDIFMVPPAVNQ
jgi:DNA/RNA endonuclease YhcR with UshA esterase domain